MDKNLTTSNIERQNILNNSYALRKIRTYVGLPSIEFEGENWLTKQMVADFFEVDSSTVDRYIEKYSVELKHNGYVLIKGKRLKDLKSQFSHIINVGSKTTQLSLFNFRSFLNISMLLIDSEKARILRSKILDIVINSINEKTGGNTKYINQRDSDYLTTAIKEPKYRKEFTSALSKYLDMGNYKYAVYTDKIYKAIFKEKAVEYRNILKLKAKDNLRETLYVEVLELIASFEVGLAHELKKESKKCGRKLLPTEFDAIFQRFADHPLHSPLVDKARIKMASRDLHFRDAFHKKLEHYIEAVPIEDFEFLLGDQSMDFDKQLEQAKEVFKRLKESD
ncbi:MAG: DNA-binding protein [Desulfobacteraceae bacterium 4572_130]|nr:MAG: DNA-binding protein [Desulfobacteraceae bacterium 4572_130]